MSVHPVQPGSTGVEPPTPEKKVRATAPAASAEVGRSAKVEIVAAHNSPVPSVFPEHEVKVVVDASTNGVLVYRTLDKKSGDVVVQVPSATALKEIHQIQELLKRTAPRGRDATPVAAQGSIPAATAGSIPVAAPDAGSAPAAPVKGEEKINGR